jgi:DNA topoisomerase-1
VDKDGIRRVRSGRGFSYLAPDGSRLAAGHERDRVTALAIPPAWTEVWIAPHANDHIQATGPDAAGRVQYIYHTSWRDKMDQQKFERMLGLAKALPAVHRAVARDLMCEG